MKNACLQTGDGLRSRKPEDTRHAHLIKAVSLDGPRGYSVSKGLRALEWTSQRPRHLGRSSQVWDVKIHDEAGNLVCVSRVTMGVLSLPNQY